MTESIEDCDAMRCEGERKYGVLGYKNIMICTGHASIMSIAPPTKEIIKFWDQLEKEREEK